LAGKGIGSYAAFDITFIMPHPGLCRTSPKGSPDRNAPAASGYATPTPAPIERLDARGDLIFPKSWARLDRRRVCLTTWRPAAYRSLRPRLVRSSLARIRTGMVEPAQLLFSLEARVGPAAPCPRRVPTCRRPHAAGRLRSTARQPSVLSTPCRPGDGQPPDRSGTPNAEGEMCLPSPRPDMLCPRRPPPEQKPKKRCPDATRRRG
jgi:hypothetical protein